MRILIESLNQSFNSEDITWENHLQLLEIQ